MLDFGGVVTFLMFCRRVATKFPSQDIKTVEEMCVAIKDPKTKSDRGDERWNESQLPSPNPWSQNEGHWDELRLICFNQILFGGIFFGWIFSKRNELTYTQRFPTNCGWITIKINKRFCFVDEMTMTGTGLKSDIQLHSTGPPRYPTNHSNYRSVFGICVHISNS